MITELDHIYSVFSRETLDTMTKNHKVAYKYCLGAIFINLIVGAGHTKGQKDNFGIAEGVKKLDRKKTDFNGVVQAISLKVNDSLKENNFISPYNTELLDKLILFTRKRILELREKERSLFQASELMEVIDLKSFFGIRSVEKHHWVEFNLHSGLVLTLPEAIVFHDLKVHWNEYIRLRELLEEEQARLKPGKEKFEYYKLDVTREKFYKLTASARALIFLCVSFVESYLLNLFHTIKESDVPGKEHVSAMLMANKIEDETIVRAIIYKLFPEHKAAIDDMFKSYLATTKFRNRYVHASPFMDASTGCAEMQPLLNVSDEQVVDSLQNAIDMIHTLDELLPDNLKLLFWWYDEPVVFRNHQPLKLTNSFSRYNRMKYENI